MVVDIVIAIPDATLISARFVVSAIFCRFVVVYELDGMRLAERFKHQHPRYPILGSL